jgi:hypothetical protein
MAVKLAVLKSGENVIADIKQLVDDNDKVMSLVFTNPYVVTLLTPQILFESQTHEEYEHKVSFYPWIVFSNDKVIEVDPTWVVCVVDPNEMLKSSYEEKMNSTTEGAINKELSIAPESQDSNYANVEVLSE